MSGPRSMFTSEHRTPAAQQWRRLWRLLEVIGTLGVLLVGALTAMGWRIQKPGDVLSDAEKAIAGASARISVLEANYGSLSFEVKVVQRVQCLGITRREAQVADVCKNVPTRDELARSPR